MSKPANVKLTHFGRKSGKRYDTDVWWTEIDGDVWIGTQDVSRNWFRNVEETGIVELNFGEGPKAFVVARCQSEDEIARFEASMLSKHPIGARVIRFLSRGKKLGCFKLQPAKE